MPYLYRPEGDRTPVNDPVLGHLSYDGVYENPACADDPRFEKVTDPDDKTEVENEEAAPAPADSPDTPVMGEETAPPKRASASKPGRS